MSFQRVGQQPSQIYSRPTSRVIQGPHFSTNERPLIPEELARLKELLLPAGGFNYTTHLETKSKIKEVGTLFTPFSFQNFDLFGSMSGLFSKLTSQSIEVSSAVFDGGAVEYPLLGGDPNFSDLDITIRLKRKNPGPWSDAEKADVEELFYEQLEIAAQIERRHCVEKKELRFFQKGSSFAFAVPHDFEDSKNTSKSLFRCRGALSGRSCQGERYLYSIPFSTKERRCDIDINFIFEDQNLDPEQVSCIGSSDAFEIDIQELIRKWPSEGHRLQEKSWDDFSLLVRTKDGYPFDRSLAQLKRKEFDVHPLSRIYKIKNGLRGYVKKLTKGETPSRGIIEIEFVRAFLLEYKEMGGEVFKKSLENYLKRHYQFDALGRLAFLYNFDQVITSSSEISLEIKYDLQAMFSEMVEATFPHFKSSTPQQRALLFNYGKCFLFLNYAQPDLFLHSISHTSLPQKNQFSRPPCLRLRYPAYLFSQILAFWDEPYLNQYAKELFEVTKTAKNGESLKSHFQELVWKYLVSIGSLNDEELTLLKSYTAPNQKEYSVFFTELLQLLRTSRQPRNLLTLANRLWMSDSKVTLLEFPPFRKFATASIKATSNNPTEVLITKIVHNKPGNLDFFFTELAKRLLKGPPQQKNLIIEIAGALLQLHGEQPIEFTHLKKAALAPNHQVNWQKLYIAMIKDFSSQKASYPLALQVCHSALKHFPNDKAVQQEVAIFLNKPNAFNSISKLRNGAIDTFLNFTTQQTLPPWLTLPSEFRKKCIERAFELSYSKFKQFPSFNPAIELFKYLKEYAPSEEIEVELRDTIYKLLEKNSALTNKQALDFFTEFAKSRLYDTAPVFQLISSKLDDEILFLEKIISLIPLLPIHQRIALIEASEAHLESKFKIQASLIHLRRSCTDPAPDLISQRAALIKDLNSETTLKLALRMSHLALAVEPHPTAVLEAVAPLTYNPQTSQLLQSIGSEMTTSFRALYQSTNRQPWIQLSPELYKSFQESDLAQRAAQFILNAANQTQASALDLLNFQQKEQLTSLKQNVQVREKLFEMLKGLLNEPKAFKKLFLACLANGLLNEEQKMELGNKLLDSKAFKERLPQFFTTAALLAANVPALIPQLKTPLIQDFQTKRDKISHANLQNYWKVLRKCRVSEKGHSKVDCYICPLLQEIIANKTLDPSRFHSKLLHLATYQETNTAATLLPQVQEILETLHPAAVPQLTFFIEALQKGDANQLKIALIRDFSKSNDKNWICYAMTLASATTFPPESKEAAHQTLHHPLITSIAEVHEAALKLYSHLLSDGLFDNAPKERLRAALLLSGEGGSYLSSRKGLSTLAKLKIAFYSSQIDDLLKTMPKCLPEDEKEKDKCLNLLVEIAKQLPKERALAILSSLASYLSEEQKLELKKWALQLARQVILNKPADSIGAFSLLKTIIDHPFATVEEVHGELIKTIQGKKYNWEHKPLTNWHLSLETFFCKNYPEKFDACFQEFINVAAKADIAAFFLPDLLERYENQIMALQSTTAPHFTTFLSFFQAFLKLNLPLGKLFTFYQKQIKQIKPSSISQLWPSLIELTNAFTAHKPQIIPHLKEIDQILQKLLAHINSNPKEHYPLFTNFSPAIRKCLQCGFITETEAANLVRSIQKKVAECAKLPGITLNKDLLQQVFYLSLSVIKSSTPPPTDIYLAAIQLLHSGINQKIFDSPTFWLHWKMLIDCPKSFSHIVAKIDLLCKLQDLLIAGIGSCPAPEMINAFLTLTRTIITISDLLTFTNENNQALKVFFSKRERVLAPIEKWLETAESANLEALKADFYHCSENLCTIIKDTFAKHTPEIKKSDKNNWHSEAACELIFELINKKRVPASDCAAAIGILFAAMFNHTDLKRIKSVISFVLTSTYFSSDIWESWLAHSCLNALVMTCKENLNSKTHLGFAYQIFPAIEKSFSPTLDGFDLQFSLMNFCQLLFACDEYFKDASKTNENKNFQRRTYILLLKTLNIAVDGLKKSSYLMNSTDSEELIPDGIFQKMLWIHDPYFEASSGSTPSNNPFDSERVNLTYFLKNGTVILQNTGDEMFQTMTLGLMRKIFESQLFTKSEV